MEGYKNATFQVAIIGSHRIRVAKVLSLLNDDSDDNDKLASSSLDAPTTESISNPSSTVNQNDDDDDDDRAANAILRQSVEYIPCVATFDSYENEDGNVVRYLARIEHHGLNATQVRGSSLAPFFDDDGVDAPVVDVDDDDPTDESKTGTTTSPVVPTRIPGVAAVAIGCGIETKQEVAMIMTFLQSMSIDKKVVLATAESSTSTTTTQADEGSNNGNNKNCTIVQCIQPNAEYESMEVENQAYKQMGREEKHRVTRKRTIGPGKMATFVQSLAKEIGITHRIIPSSPRHPPSNSELIDIRNEDDTEIVPMLIELNDTVQHGHDRNVNDDNHQSPQPQTPIHQSEQVVQHDKTQFSCKQCRTILFSEHDLEDPPHAKAQHTFHRNNRNTSSSSSPCESVFLAEGLDWMGDISTSMEGKLSCPRCAAKLGLWKWAGSQCSCGTWVTPAIQIHLSRVDVMLPDGCCRSGMAGLPLGTVMPRVASLPMAGLYIANGS